MPDWSQIVQRRLARLRLDEDEAAQVREEIAGHLEQSYQSFLAAGLAEEVAKQRAIAVAGNWQDLQRNIESSRKKEPHMSNRVTQFWLPALATLFLAMVLLMIIQAVGPSPWVSASGAWRRIAPVAVVYVSWLLCLLPVGALGAYMSRRAGGSARAVFVSTLFPVLPYLAFFVIGLPVVVVLDDHVAHNIMLPALFVGFGSWVLLPAIALLAGGLPVYYLSARPTTRAV